MKAKMPFLSMVGDQKVMTSFLYFQMNLQKIQDQGTMDTDNTNMTNTIVTDSKEYD